MERLSLVVPALLLAGLLSVSSAAAQEVSACDWRSSAENLPEPWERHTRSFANGDVRIAILDVVEPASAAFHLLVLSPPWAELGIRQCRIVSLGEGLGFFSATLAGMTARYDPASGLVLDIPVELPDSSTGEGRPARLRLIVNQASGEIRASVE
jgi:hypothetical protein